MREIDPSPEVFAEWLLKLCAKDPEAFEAMVKWFGLSVQMVIRRQLTDCARREVDTKDTYQETMIAFLQTSLEKYNFQRPEDLREFLKKLAIRQATRAHRRATAQKRGGGGGRSPLGAGGGGGG